MYQGKYMDKIFDGRWKVIGFGKTSGTYTLENIFNHRTIALSNKQVKSVLEGKTTISQIVCRRIGNNNGFVDNRTIKGFHKQIKKYSQGGSK